MIRSITSACLAFILFTAYQPVFSQDTSLGVVTDFEQSTALDSILQVIVSEINRTTGTSKQVTLAPEGVRYGSTDFTKAKDNYDVLSGQVDFMLLLGDVSTKGALTDGPLPVPTIGLGVIDPYLQNIPLEDGASGVENFSYIWSAINLAEELAQFKDMYSFDSLAILVNSQSVNTFDQQKGQRALDSISQALSTVITIVPVGEDVASSLSTIPTNTDAVYLSSLVGKPPSAIRQIADELKTRKLPSFSADKSFVDQGILACIADENGFGQALRKLSIMVDDALGGSPLSEMSVAINFKERFYLNMTTARAIAFSPPFELFFTARLIGEDERNGKTIYSLEDIMERALEQNLAIAISYQDIELSEQDIRAARSALLPNLGLSLSGSQINPDQANALFGQAERQLSGTLNFQQLIYAEQAVANVKIAKFIKEAQEYDTQADVLSVLLDTYNEYFRVLAAKTDAQIQEENLSISETNLELARVRVNVGAATNAEVYRWESEVARAKQNAINAQTGVLATKLRLNTFLANSLEQEFDIDDVTIDDTFYQELSKSPISELVRTPADLAIASEFLVQEALAINPNKNFLLANIRQAERQRLQNQRLFYIPEVALTAQAGRILGRGGEASVEPPDISFIDNTWQIGIGLNYPIFQGNLRKANLQRSIVQLEQLDFARQQLDQDLTLAVRSSVLQLLNATTNIGFSEIASDNAQRNFTLVQDNYRQGTVNITQLIDAQQAAIQAKLSYALAIYDYLQAQLQLEFTVGFFSMFTEENQLTDFEDRFFQYKQAAE